jgi:DNA-binding CsgD family transcriptional regulator
MRHETVMPLTLDGTVDHRLVLWRADGPDFSDHEQLLLTLIRPHIADAERVQQRPQSLQLLTSRQRELLALVGAGLTNRQIGRRLQISEGTVRRHLENIFDRLSVTSRAAAVAQAATPADQRSVPVEPVDPNPFRIGHASGRRSA